MQTDRGLPAVKAILFHQPMVGWYNISGQVSG
jgi:hypothetical protein